MFTDVLEGYNAMPLQHSDMLITAFQKNVLPLFSECKDERVYSCEITVPTYQVIRFHYPDHSTNFAALHRHLSMDVVASPRNLTTTVATIVETSA
jgi:hypothetical protein